MDKPRRVSGTAHRVLYPVLYLPLQKKCFDTVEINIITDTGQPVPFRYGKWWKSFVVLEFRRHIPIDGWDLTTSVFEKKTNVRHIGILLSVLISTTSCNFHVILHHATEFRPNRSNRCGNITSYPYIKMAAATAEYYFRFRICWCHWQYQVIGSDPITWYACGCEVFICQQTNTIGNWDAIFRFTFHFRFTM